LVTLISVEVLKVGTLRAAGIIKVVHRVRTGAGGVMGTTGVAATHSITLARLLQVLVSSVDLCNFIELIREGVVILRLRATGA
jgi:hypothetical protein